MAAEPDLHLEIAHVLFMDVVGYSKLLINDQTEVLEQLNQVVRQTLAFLEAEAAGKLIRIATGDGMALVFFNSAEAPVKCAVEIAEALQNHPNIPLRMGVHSGPINPINDVNDRSNVTGAGINMAQRVMDCGDAGHILVSRRVAEDLEQYRRWQPYLHELGECEVKHGHKISIVNFYDDQIGNPEVPEKFKEAQRTKATATLRRRGLFVGIGILLAAALALFVYKRQPFRSAAPKPSSEKSVAVLPLENLSEEKENAFFADGIQDELLSNLAKIKNLKVISRTSVMQYKSGITRNLKEIAQQLGVTNVVEGTVRRSGNHVRVSVQLIDALTDHHIWVQNYDRTLADSLALQGELATEIAAGVGATLSPQEKARVEARPTNNTAAYDAYLRGRVFAGGSPFDRSNVEGAIRSYQEAVRLDPSFALAWVYLSSADSGLYWNGGDPTPARLAAAKDAADRAVALDPNLPEIHLAIGYYRYYGLRDFTGALAEFQQAEQGLPNNVDVIRAIGLIQRRLARWDAAIAAQRRAVELDPRNIDAAIILATTYRGVRRFPEVHAITDRILALEPTNGSALLFKAGAFWAAGDLEAVEPLLANPGTDPFLRGMQALFKRHYDAAVENFSKALAGAPVEENIDSLLNLGLSQQRAGEVAAARATYQQAVQEFHRLLKKVTLDSLAPNHEAALHNYLGWAYAGLGEAASAIAEGQKAMAIRSTSKDPSEGPAQEESMAGIYALLGDAEHAIPILKRLLQIPYVNSITPALLRLDPIWDQIRNDPRFQELAAEKKQ